MAQPLPLDRNQPDDTAPFLDADYPDHPYPGARPAFSYLHTDGQGWPLRSTPLGWRVDPTGQDLDQWLADRGDTPLAGRIPVLAYGSNACPSKITWLRDAWALRGAVVVLRARCDGLAAVWAAGFRIVDDQRPATLAAAPGVEDHAVWLATPDQLRALDGCEGRGDRYRLSWLHSGRITLDGGARLDRVLAYTATAPIRLPLLVDGAPVRCADVPQERAVDLAGEPATTDGLNATTVAGAPHPDEWPDRLFVYGTLAPGQRAWPLVRPFTASATRTWLPGALYDTGLGYPALRLEDGPGVPGWVLRLRSPRNALPVLDDYEGEDYQRVRVTLPDGEVCWTYQWTASTRGLRALPGGWYHADAPNG